MTDQLIKIVSKIPDLPTKPGCAGSRVQWSEAAHEYLVYLSKEEWDALRAILLMLKLTDLLEQQRMIRAFPKLVNAVKLVLAIADHAEANPEETVKLATKTRKQLEKALVIADE